MSDEAKKPTPAGWYPHPNMVNTLRYWNGTSWTQHISATGAVGGKSRDEASTRHIYEAQRVARAIDIIKWLLISVLVVMTLVGVVLGIAGEFSEEETFVGGSLATGAFFVVAASLYALFIWIVLGWAQHTLGMLATIARNTGRR